MLVKCPECSTTYNLDESKIGHEGSKVRCTRCKHVFTAFRPQPEHVARESASTARKSAQTSQDAFEEEFASLFSEKKAPASKKVSVDEDMLADLQGAFQQPLIDKQGSRAALEEERPQRASKSGRLGALVVILFLVLAALGGGVYYLKPSLLGINPEPPGSPSTADAAAKEGVAHITLENVRQYFVPNEKEGQLFIIEGRAINRFEEPRELIRLKASLFDKQGGEVASQEFMCGNVVSLYQLQVSTRAEIEAALTAKVGILTNNTNIQPGASVPFMVVFFNASDSVEEFGLEVIQSSIPAR